LLLTKLLAFRVILLLDILPLCFQSALNEFMLHQSGNFYILVEVEKEATQSTPSLEDLLGDKLTAFAPNTTGITYFSYR